MPQLQTPRFNSRPSKLLPLSTLLPSLSYPEPPSNINTHNTPHPGPALSLPAHTTNLPGNSSTHTSHSDKKATAARSRGPTTSRHSKQPAEWQLRAQKFEAKRFRPHRQGRRSGERLGTGGGEGAARGSAGTGPSHDSGRGPESSGVHREKGGEGVIAMATVPHPPAVQTSKEGGRTSNPNRQRSSGSFLKGYTQRRRRRRAGEGRAGRPRPSGDAPAAPSPPLVHPWQQPRERPGGGGRPGPPPWNSVASPGPAPGDEKGVCERPVGARTSPPFSRRLPSPGRRPAGPLPPSWQGGPRAARGAEEFRGQRERAASSGARRAGPN